MAVYVDPLHTFNNSDEGTPRCFFGKSSCHMYADTLEELHAMAARISLKRSWFQDSPHLRHYDLTEGRRIAAVRAGVIEHTRAEAVAKWREVRGAGVKAEAC